MTKHKRVSSSKKASCPKKTKNKSCKKDCKSKSKNINVVPVPSPVLVNVPFTVPTDLKIIDRLKNIKDKVFSTFGLGPKDSP